MLLFLLCKRKDIQHLFYTILPHIQRLVLYNNCAIRVIYRLQRYKNICKPPNFHVFFVKKVYFCILTDLFSRENHGLQVFNKLLKRRLEDLESTLMYYTTHYYI